MNHGIKVRAGEMRVPIEIHNPTTTGSGISKTTTYTKALDARCRWINAHGREGRIADSVQTTAQATLTMRYHASVNRASRIKKDDQFWELITEPDNIHENGRWLQFQVQAVRSG